jgi:hypothetical protein
MDIPEKIDLVLYEYYKNNPTQPSGILMHPNTSDDLYDMLCEMYHFPPDRSYCAKYKGIDIYCSHDLHEGEIKLIY